MVYAMPKDEKPSAQDMDEPVKVDLAPEDALKAMLEVDPEAEPVDVRWHIVNALSGKPAVPPNPPDGFASEIEAKAFLTTVFRDAPELVVRPVPDRLPG